MHFRTHIKDGSRGKAGRWQSEYHDTMVDHDELVGSVLDFLDENGLADNTIVMYSTDNGPHMNTLARRRHDAVPQREELELGGRLPGAGHGPLARPHPGRRGAATASSATTTGSSPCSPPPVTPTSPTG